MPDDQRQRPYIGHGYAPRHEPPKRKSWPIRHRVLAFVAYPVVAVVVIVTAAVAASRGLGSSPVAGPDTCTSHHVVSADEWAQIVKDPEAGKGQCIVVYGQVVQFDGITGPGFFRAEAGPSLITPSYGFVNYPTASVIFAGDAGKLKPLAAGDLFSAEVTVDGSATYDTATGGTASAPVLRVDSILKTGHLDSY